MTRAGVAPAKILFVSSNSTHSTTFKPIIDGLTAAGSRCVLVSLAQFHGDDGTRADSPGSVMLRRRAGPLPPNAFYGRSVPSIWLDVLRARRQVDGVLDVEQPSRLVLGNDFGLLEKLFLARARARGIRSVLVQDGRLGKRPSDVGRRRLLRLAKSSISPFLRAMGLSYLAASEYGEGGSDVICAADVPSAELLRARASSGTTVLVTGQPRYDRLRDVVPAPDDRRLARRSVVMFTTPFHADRLGDVEQAAQQAFAAALADLVRDRGGELVVRPHPRESPDGYRSIPYLTVSDEAPFSLLREAWIAVIGISTVVEEAVLLGVPVIVPGGAVHSRRFEHRLPDPRWFPRIDTIARAGDLLAELADASAWSAVAERQRSALLGLDSAESPPSAAKAIVDAILTQ